MAERLRNGRGAEGWPDRHQDLSVLQVPLLPRGDPRIGFGAPGERSDRLHAFAVLRAYRPLLRASPMNPSPPPDGSAATSAGSRVRIGLSRRLSADAVSEVLRPLLPGLLASPLPSAVASLTSRYLFANAAYCELVGRDLAQLRTLSVADITHPEDVDIERSALRAVARGYLHEHQMRKRYVRPGGQAVEAWIHVGTVRDSAGLPVALVGQVLDSAVRLVPNSGSMRDERSFALLFGANPQPMWIFDATTLRILEVNGAACAHYGYTRRQFRSRTIADIRPAGDVPTLHDHLAMSRSPLRNSGVWRHVRADGQVIEVEIVSHEIVFDCRDAILVSIQDVTQRNLLERQLMHLALHDQLSGLPNRALFLDRLGQALALCEGGQGGVVGVLYLDVDGIQLVNETLGHQAGDTVLALLGTQLDAKLPAGTTVGSIVGEELAICAPGLPDVAAAVALARLTQAIIAEPLVLPGDVEVGLGACVGVTAAAGTGSEPADLLRDAAVAAGQARQIGPGEIVVIEHPARRDASGCLGARRMLQRAIEAGQIHAYFQPVVSLADKVVVGAEALARWVHPERGIVLPAEFIGLAEESGLIAALGRSMLMQACQHAAAWPQGSPGRAPMMVSVNVSGRQLRDEEFPVLVRQVLADTGLDPGRLALEVTETVLLDYGDIVASGLAALRDLGTHLGIDDFGTGYSSLSYLDRLPFDIVKIDRSFVTGMHDDPRHQAIVASVISLADTLGLTVVAEGVESAVEAADLGHLGARLAQGYHFYAPMPAHRLAALLRRSGTAPTRE